MPPGNTLVGDDVLYMGSADRAQPNAPPAGPTIADANRIANLVAFLVLLALAALILIRIAGLQGMIAVRAGA